MESVSVAKLKSRLSHYLNSVRHGSEIIVTSHQHPIAKIGPVAKAVSGLQIIPAKKPISSLKKIKGLNLLTDLLADRRPQ